MLKRDKKAEFLEVGIVSMKYQSIRPPAICRAGIPLISLEYKYKSSK